MTDQKKKPKPTLKDVEHLLQQWRRLLLNKPYFISLAGDVRQLADDLLDSKAIWIDKDGIIHSTVSGSRRLKRYKKKFQKRKREEGSEANGTNDKSDMG